MIVKNVIQCSPVQYNALQAMGWSSFPSVLCSTSIPCVHGRTKENGYHSFPRKQKNWSTILGSAAAVEVPTGCSAHTGRHNIFPYVGTIEVFWVSIHTFKLQSLQYENAHIT